MSRYYFHLQDGAFVPDRNGLELESLEEARRRAIAFSSDLLQQETEKFWDGTQWQITVTDEDGTALFVLNFFASEVAS